MGLLDRLRGWITDNDEQATSPELTENPADRTTIDDAEATSLRAIKLPDKERNGIDADEREP
ncbi:hypothetical protein [Halonotius roseus]|uniref:Uncharacterized protein n=1 Tax=Halonotius roseus TaxID=2511997 RepID=A0A544QKF8_9EURY|nr:hypothetical protein [Halonotius roseus]TQQ78861.1 hypothetical protein EWF95_12060 [Halonotius roseus]